VRGGGGGALIGAAVGVVGLGEEDTAGRAGHLADRTESVLGEILRHAIAVLCDQAKSVQSGDGLPGGLQVSGYLCSTRKHPHLGYRNMGIYLFNLAVLPPLLSTWIED